MKREDLLSYLGRLLKPQLFRDYCPNGLQVQGKDEIQRIVTGVTASQALIDAAIAHKADAILVHHGYFWKNESAPIVGMKHQRIKRLLTHDINLIAYHLPLDAHATLGNNRQLAIQLDIMNAQSIAPEKPTELVWRGDVPAQSATEFAAHIAKALGRKPLHIAPEAHGDMTQYDSESGIIRTVAWCTGGAQHAIHEAAELGVDAYISGEVSEATFHAAKELGIHYFAAGHHATERYGAKALGEHLAEQFTLDVTFVDIPNPV